MPHAATTGAITLAVTIQRRTARFVVAHVAVVPRLPAFATSLTAKSPASHSEANIATHTISDVSGENRPASTGTVSTGSHGGLDAGPSGAPLEPVCCERLRRQGATRGPIPDSTVPPAASSICHSTRGGSMSLTSRRMSQEPLLVGTAPPSCGLSTSAVTTPGAAVP